MGTEGAVLRSCLGNPASLTAVAKPGSKANVRGGAADKNQEAGKDQEQEQRAGGAGRQKISTGDIQQVQNLIERCLQQYMPQKDVAATLQAQAKIEPGFTNLVWEKLEEQNPDFFKAYYLRLKVNDQIVMFNYLLEQQVMMVQRLQMGWMQNTSMMVPRPGVPPMGGSSHGSAAAFMQGAPGMGMPGFPPLAGIGAYPMMPMPGLGAASAAPGTNLAAGTSDDLLDPFAGIDCLGEGRGHERRCMQQHNLPTSQQGSEGHLHMQLGDVLPNLPKNFSFSDFGNFDLQLGHPGSGHIQTLSDFHLPDNEGDRLMMPSSSRAAPSLLDLDGGEGSSRLLTQPARPGVSGSSCSEDNAAVMMPACIARDEAARDITGPLSDAGVVSRNDEEHSMLMLGDMGPIDESGDCMTGSGLPRNFSFGDMAPIDFGVLADHDHDQH